MSEARPGTPTFAEAKATPTATTSAVEPVGPSAEVQLWILESREIEAVRRKDFARANRLLNRRVEIKVLLRELAAESGGTAGDGRGPAALPLRGTAAAK